MFEAFIRGTVAAAASKSMWCVKGPARLPVVFGLAGGQQTRAFRSVLCPETRVLAGTEAAGSLVVVRQIVARIAACQRLCRLTDLSCGLNT